MRVIYTNEKYAPINELVDCFYSFFILDETLCSVHRRHRLFSPLHWPKTQTDNISQIVLTEYANKDPAYIRSETVLCDGNDPRVVVDNQTAYVLSEGALHSETVCTLTILPEKRNVKVQLGAGTVAGKNWQPFVHQQQLYVVDSISPFRINKLDTTTGVLSKQNQTETDFNLTATHDRYSILRGGSNAIIDDYGAILGTGHATIAPYEHIPFLWKYQEDTPIISLINLQAPFKAKGYHVVDPTSFFCWDTEHYAIGLSCSQRDWFHPQWFLNALLLIRKDELHQLRGLGCNLETMRNSRIFHAWNLDSLIDSVKQDGGLYNNRQGGWLLCGPSEEIPLDKAWTVDFCYASDDDIETHIGTFDILLTIDGVDTHVVSASLFGTNGRSTRARLEFRMDSARTPPTALIQTRAHAQQGASMTGYFFELNHE